MPAWSDIIPTVRESQCGIIVRPGHPNELLDAIEGLRSDPELGRRMGENARRYARQHLALEFAVSRFESVLALAAQNRW